MITGFLFKEVKAVSPTTSVVR